MRILVTGANGHLGLKLIAALNSERPGDEVVAMVRSERAADQVRGAGVKAEIAIVDYRDAAGIAKAGQGCDAVIHLVGIIKESAANSFQMAHEDACTALVEAGLDASRIICLGIVGTSSSSANACLRSRAAAEDILLGASIPATVLRVPMVLGAGDYASAALARNGSKKISFSFRAASLEQPIFSEDVVKAILAALALEPADRVIELAGPESLSRRALVQRAGQLLGNSPTVISLPLWLGMMIAGLMELIASAPPVTRAMLGVLDHDDQLDPTEAAEQLGITLTSLDDMLGAVLDRQATQ